jgi:hypothetical protein
MTEFWTNILLPSLINGGIGTVGAVLFILIYNTIRFYTGGN